MAGNYPELMVNLKETELRQQFSKRLQMISNGRDLQGRRIFIFRAGRFILHTIFYNFNSIIYLY